MQAGLPNDDTYRIERLESCMLGNGHVQFGGGPMEKGRRCTSPAAYPTPFTVAFRTRLVAQTAEERFARSSARSV